MKYTSIVLGEKFESRNHVKMNMIQNRSYNIQISCPDVVLMIQTDEWKIQGEKCLF